jgi:glycosyltransferase involved in cell wall biosynthesis
LSSSKSPRVLFLISKIGPGGAQKIVIDLVNAVVSSGGDAHILVNYQLQQDTAFYKRIDSKVTVESFSGEVPHIKGDKFQTLQKIFILIKAPFYAAYWVFSGKLQNFNIVHSHLLVGSVISWWMRVCVFFSTRSRPVFVETFHSDFATTKRWERAAFLFLWHTLDLLVLEYRRRDVKIISSRINCPVEYIPFGVESYAQPESQYVNQFKEKYELSQDLPVILTIARINFNDKRIDKLIETISKLKSSFGEGFTYLLCGDGKDYYHAVQLARDCGIRNQVKFTGYINDPTIPISFARIFLVSGVEDLVGIAGLNAASRGVPVLTYQKDPNWDKQGEFFFNSRSTFEIANEIHRLLEDEGYYEVESKRCEQVMRDHFNVQSMTRGYLSLYREIGIKNQ